MAPDLVWPLPDELLGGLDVGSLALGAVAVPSLDPTGEAALHDGLAIATLGFSADFASLPVTLTVDLAGDQPTPIVGTIIDPLAGAGAIADVPSSVELLLSSDGVTYTRVLATDLSTLMSEQAFVLDGPVEATHAQLRLSGAHGGGSGGVWLGEWKVIAMPGVVPAGLPEAAAAAGAGLDLARRSAGRSCLLDRPAAARPGDRRPDGG